MTVSIEREKKWLQRIGWVFACNPPRPGQQRWVVTCSNRMYKVEGIGPSESAAWADAVREVAAFEIESRR